LYVNGFFNLVVLMAQIGVVIWLRRDPFDRFLSFAREAQIGHPHCQAKVCD